MEDGRLRVENGADANLLLRQGQCMRHFLHRHEPPVLDVPITVGGPTSSSHELDRVLGAFRPTSLQNVALPNVHDAASGVGSDRQCGSGWKASKPACPCGGAIPQEHSSRSAAGNASRAGRAPSRAPLGQGSLWGAAVRPLVSFCQHFTTADTGRGPKLQMVAGRVTLLVSALPQSTSAPSHLSVIEFIN